MGGSTFFLMAGLAGIGLIAAFGVAKFWGGGLLTDAQPKVEFV